MKKKKVKTQTGTETPEGPQKLFSVSEFIEFLNVFFKQQEFRITGEITQFKRQINSGHCYFTIKDKDTGAVLDCIIWSRNYDVCGVALEVGMEIILTGRPNIYGPSGRLSFIGDTVELVGEGALKKAYDALKKKLTEEGLFDPARKRVLPQFPCKIGVITSREGAVIHDFINNLGHFGFQVFLVDSRVEGQIAVADIRLAVQTMRKQDIEVLVIIRGGGSLESLQAFNNETLVREIAEFPVPVIAGIGHDQDVPLLAMVADHTTSTPTAAAHLLNHFWEEAYLKLQQVIHLPGRVMQEIKRIQNDLNFARAAVLDHAKKQIQQAKERIIFAERSLNLNNPERQLRLGYSIVRHNGKILRSIKAIEKGDELNTQVADGTIQSRVENL